MSPKTASKSSKKAKAPEPEEDEDLEELDDDEEEEAPKKKRSDDVDFGVADLVALVKEKTGKEYTTRDMRTLLRKMAREDKPRVDREVVAGNRARYNWPDGANDPEVKRIIKAVGSGEIEAGKKEALDKLKEQKAKKQAAATEKPSKKAKGKKAKKAPEPEPDEDDEDFEDLEDEDDD